jgi:hypothetical protein
MLTTDFSGSFAKRCRIRHRAAGSKMCASAILVAYFVFSEIFETNERGGGPTEAG